MSASVFSQYFASQGRLNLQNGVTSSNLPVIKFQFYLSAVIARHLYFDVCPEKLLVHQSNIIPQLVNLINNNNNNFIYPGRRPVSQSTKVDRLLSIGDQHTRIYKILT